MRKLICMIMILGCILCIAGCQSSAGDAVVVNPNASAPAADNAGDTTRKSNASGASDNQTTLYFQANDVKIHVYDLADDVLAALGDANNKFEAPSCAYQGVDVFYYYDGFQLTVNDIDGADHVSAVMVVDDTVSIPQGVKIGSTKEEMLQLMGDNYEEASGLYRFIEGYTTLQIQIKDDVVASILYVYTPQS